MRGRAWLEKRVINVKNRRLSDDEFWEEREKILALWPTGKEVDLDEAIEYHKNLPSHKVFTKKFQWAKRNGRVLTQPRGGVCLLDKYIAKLKVFQDKGRADLLPGTMDSYTRNSRYDLVEKAINDSKKAGRPLLNGCSFTNWGVKGVRQVVEETDLPNDARTCDILSCEIGLNAGITGILVAALSQLAYLPTLTPEAIIRRYQQLSRLVGYYEEHGVPIYVDVLPLTSSSYYANSLEVAQVIIDALLEAEQGIKYFGLRFTQNFQLVQDIAKGKAMEELAQEYFSRFGYGDAELFLAYDAWNSAWPLDAAQASAMIAMGAMTAQFSGACKIMVKSTDEAHGLPTDEAQAFSLRETKQMLNILHCQEFPMCKEVEDEKRLIMTEARLIIEKVLELGDGDIAVGAVRALDVGVLENPFSSSPYNLGKVLPSRDVTGAVIYLNTGNLPFTKEIIEYHRERINERKKVEKLEKNYILLLNDMLTFAKPLEEVEAKFE